MIFLNEATKRHKKDINENKLLYIVYSTFKDD